MVFTRLPPDSHKTSQIWDHVKEKHIFVLLFETLTWSRQEDDSNRAPPPSHAKYKVLLHHSYVVRNVRWLQVWLVGRSQWGRVRKRSRVLFVWTDNKLVKSSEFSRRQQRLPQLPVVQSSTKTRLPSRCYSNGLMQIREGRWQNKKD